MLYARFTDCVFTSLSRPRRAGQLMERGADGPEPPIAETHAPPPPPPAAPAALHDSLDALALEPPAPPAPPPPGLMAALFGGGDGVVTLPQVPETMRRAAPPSERERIETEIIKALMASYFNIVRKTWLDLVPKAIMHFMVRAAKEGLQNELVSQLYKEELLADAMRETPEVAARRRAIAETHALLHRALAVVNEVRDHSAGPPAL
jgi:hypothetical protein